LDLEVEVSMKTTKQPQNKSVLFKTEKPVCLNDDQDSTDFVAVHDLRSSGAHRLEIYVSYIVESVNIIDNSVIKKPSYMRKIYDIQVETPIKIVMNYPYLSTRTCLAEASIENISTTDVNLTKFLLEPVEGFEFIDKIDEEAQFYLRPQEKATRTFSLQLKDGKPFKAGRYKYAKLNIIWRRGISCVGKLQTPTLTMDRKPEVAVEYNLVKNSVSNPENEDSEGVKSETENSGPSNFGTSNSPSNINKIPLLKTQNLEINIVNTTDSEVCVDLNLKENEYGDSVKFIGSLVHKNLVLESGSDCKVLTKFVSIRRGIHSLPSVFCTDSVTNKVQQFVDVKKVLVS